MPKIIILEDDPMIAMDIKDIAEQANFEVIEIFNHPNDVLNYQGDRPDLALLDIHLNADKTGIDIARHLQENNICAHIFLTSYFDKKTVEEAGKTNPLAYILKPFEENLVISNLELAKIKLSHNNTHEKKVENKSSHVFVKTSKSLIKIDPNKVTYVEAYDIYSKIYLENEKHIASQSLKNLELIFKNYNFIRVHRSYLVNINEIEMIQDDEITINGNQIPIGRTYKKDFFSKIKIL